MIPNEANPSTYAGTMVVGVNGKHLDDHQDPEEVEVGKESQEQAPYSMSNRSGIGQTLICPSMDKFQLAPPNLLRQVLITDTLNHIREEMNLERSAALPQEPRLELLLPSTAQSANKFLRELEVISGGLRITQDHCEPPDLSCSPTSAPDLLSDCKPTPSPLRASISPSVRVEEPALGSFEIMGNRYFGNLVPDDLFPDIDTSDVERDSWPSLFALASSSGTEWDWTELDQILEIIKGS
ncbi:LOW QUALITY PROTEIN: SERTA domain-containing protein 3 [Notamacropus eugenii]|uniref:LOW QUALITY PROTEIN: SERTA domain-containing protein 3 n=1 Tax=Notamacropus eugenii TaxID=9315 RepID=UPI003B67B8DC